MGAQETDLRLRFSQSTVALWVVMPCGLVGQYFSNGSAPPERLRNTVVGNCRFLEHVLTSPLGLIVEISFA